MQDIQRKKRVILHIVSFVKLKKSSLLLVALKTKKETLHRLICGVVIIVSVICNQFNQL